MMPEEVGGVVSTELRAIVATYGTPSDNRQQRFWNQHMHKSHICAYGLASTAVN